MKIKLLVCIGMGLVPLLSYAEGGSVGNGGGSWVCREQNESIRWVKSVDLFEAENELGLTLGQFSGSYAQIVEHMKSRLRAADADIYNRFVPYIDQLNDLKSNPPFVNFTDATLEVIHDARYRLRPSVSKCAGGIVVTDPQNFEKVIPYEQLINYKDDGTILVQSDLWDHLSGMEKAAFVIHEAIYKGLREQYGNVDSVRARQITGILFSTLSNELAGGQIRLVIGSSPYIHLEDGTGDILSMTSGIYAYVDQVHRDYCALEIDVNPAKRTVTLMEVPFPLTAKDCTHLGIVNLAATEVLDCSKVDGDHCQMDFNVASPQSIDLIKPAFDHLPRQVMYLQSFPVPTRVFQVGDNFHTDFKIPYAKYDLNTYGLQTWFQHVGPDTLKIVYRLPNGGWKVQLSGAPMSELSENPTGSGLRAPIEMDLDRSIAPNVWAGFQKISLRLRNGTICPALVAYQVEFDVGGNSGAQVRVGWPTATASYTGWAVFPGMFKHLEEAVTSCDKLRDFQTVTAEVNFQ